MRLAIDVAGTFHEPLEKIQEPNGLAMAAFRQVFDKQWTKYSTTYSLPKGNDEECFVSAFALSLVTEAIVDPAEVIRKRDAYETVVTLGNILTSSKQIRLGHTS